MRHAQQELSETPLRHWLRDRAGVAERLLENLSTKLEDAEVFELSDLRILSQLPLFNTIFKPVTAAKIHAALQCRPLHATLDANLVASASDAPSAQSVPKLSRDLNEATYEGRQLMRDLDQEQPKLEAAASGASVAVATENTAVGVVATEKSVAGATAVTVAAARIAATAFAVAAVAPAGLSAAPATPAAVASAAVASAAVVVLKAVEPASGCVNTDCGTGSSSASSGASSSSASSSSAGIASTTAVLEAVVPAAVAPGSPTAAAPTALHAGALVKLTGLQKRSDLNGERGTIIAFADGQTGRFPVMKTPPSLRWQRPFPPFSAGPP